jgi:signal transduction histidine kinase
VPSLTSIGLVELDVLASRTVTVLHQMVEADLSCVTLVDHGSELVVRAAQGQRSDHLVGLKIPIGFGIGGLAVSERRTVAVNDYSRMPATRDFHQIMVDEEGVRAATGVPLIVADHPIGVLFVGRRDGRAFAGSEIRQLQEVAHSIAPLAGASLQLAQQVHAARVRERQRMATDVHDQLVPLLFAMGAAAHRIRAMLPGNAREIQDCLASIEEMASSGNAAMRDVIRVVGPLAHKQELIQQIRARAERFATLASTPASVGVLGCPRAVDAETTEVLTAVAQVALANVARHAPGASVVITVDFGPDVIELTVQDDGIGLSEDFRLTAITDPTVGEHFGLANLTNRLRGINGDLSVYSNDDGGVTVRATVPTDPRP